MKPTRVWRQKVEIPHIKKNIVPGALGSNENINKTLLNSFFTIASLVDPEGGSSSPYTCAGSVVLEGQIIYLG